MATFTNQTKNTATITNPNKFDIAKWADAEVAWDDALFSWDSAGLTITNTTKHSATITNQIKN
jgi:hypothetical protein